MYVCFFVYQMYHDVSLSLYRRIDVLLDAQQGIGVAGNVAGRSTADEVRQALLWDMSRLLHASVERISSLWFWHVIFSVMAFVGIQFEEKRSERRNRRERYQ